jgi:hypothetical protein
VSFLKKQSSPSHDEVKRQAKSCRRISVILRSAKATTDCPSGVIFMSGAQAIGSASPTNRTPRFTAFLFGAVAYLTFVFTILYAIGFVSDFVVPKSIDAGVKTPISEAVAINLALMSLFAIQHSVMARKGFKQWWTRFIPKPVERSTYVLFASLTLLLLFWQWRPMLAVICISKSQNWPQQSRPCHWAAGCWCSPARS